MMQRLRKEIRIYACVLGGGILYLFFTATTGLGIPCPFHLVTDRLCPGCGVTRMFLSIVKLDFQAAFQHNSILFVTLPFLLAIWLFERIFYIKTGTVRLHLFSKIVLCLEATLLIVYGILRNMG